MEWVGRRAGRRRGRPVHRGRLEAGQGARATDPTADIQKNSMIADRLWSGPCSAI
jgi:hypothetical protein